MFFVSGTDFRSLEDCETCEVSAMPQPPFTFVNSISVAGIYYNSSFNLILPCPSLLWKIKFEPSQYSRLFLLELTVNMWHISGQWHIGIGPWWYLLSTNSFPLFSGTMVRCLEMQLPSRFFEVEPNFKMAGKDCCFLLTLLNHCANPELLVTSLLSHETKSYYWILSPEKIKASFLNYCTFFSLKVNIYCGWKNYNKSQTYKSLQIHQTSWVPIKYFIVIILYIIFNLKINYSQHIILC